MFKFGEKRLLKEYGLDGIDLKTLARSIDAAIAGAAMAVAFEQSAYDEVTVKTGHEPSVEGIRAKMARTDPTQAFAIMAMDTLKASGAKAASTAPPKTVCLLAVMDRCVHNSWGISDISKVVDPTVQSNARSWVAVGQAILRAKNEPKRRPSSRRKAAEQWIVQKDVLRNMSSEQLHALVYEMPWTETDFEMQRFIIGLRQCDLMTVLLMLWMIEADGYRQYMSAQDIPNNRQPCAGHAYTLIDIAFTKIQIGFYKRHGIELTTEEQRSINDRLGGSGGTPHWVLPTGLLPL